MVALPNSAYFTRLRRMPVRDKLCFVVGKLEDFVIRDDAEKAEVTGLVVKTPAGPRVIEERDVESIENCVYLKEEKSKIHFTHVNHGDLRVKDAILDKQVIDVNGLKAVRVNDVLLTQEGDKLFVTSVEVGARGLLRRLGLKILLRLPFVKTVKPHLIPWSQIEPLERKSDLKLKVERTKLNDVHPADLADLIEDLSLRERAMVFGNINEDLAADALVESNEEVQREIFKTLETEKLEGIIKKMEPNEITDFVKLLPKERAIEVLEMVGKSDATRVRDLMKYSEKTAGSVLDTNFVSVPANVTAARAIALLRPRLKKTRVYFIYVVDSSNKLVGRTHLRRIVAAAPTQRVFEFMSKRTFRVTADESLENVAKTMSKYDLLSIPVVDESNRLNGIITVDDVFELLMPEDWKKGKFIPKRVKAKK